LGQLPLAVLPTRAWSGASDAQAPWLIRQYAISSVPSASAWMSLQKLAKTPSGQQGLIAWGDPRFSLAGGAALAQTSGASGVSRGATRALNTARQQQSFDFDKPKVDVLRYAELPALPETRDELLALGKAMRADAARDLILGAAATRASVLEASNDGRLASKQVVVFATHGLLPGDLPHLDQPALAMAGSAQKDASPLLTLEDVLGLRMNADWVVLSACNTAGADGKAEEAMSGLARGFFYAGSRSLLVTHWSVESESAMLITTGTFDKYQSDATVTRSEALRSAMLKVMATKPYAHPAFWAPYALVGEGGR
jgi:CHAT domain-containing protein